MRLCEEYSLRRKISFPFILHVNKGFLFFDNDKKLLVIKWTNKGNHPGYYEISECLLESKIKTIKNTHINWDEYEDYITEWIGLHNSFVSEKSEVFNLTWEYFLRKNDKFFSENYDPVEIYETLDGESSKRILKSICFLEKVSQKHPDLSDFWYKKASDVISKYSYWMISLRNSSIPNQNSV